MKNLFKLKPNNKVSETKEIGFIKTMHLTSISLSIVLIVAISSKFEGLILIEGGNLITILIDGRKTIAK